MKKIIPLIKQVLYFIIGYIVFTSVFFIVNIIIFKSTEYTIDIKAGILETMKSLSLLYISLHLLALTINATYNTIIVRKLNEATESMRKEIKQKQTKVIKIRKRVTAITLVIAIIFIGTFLTINLRETYIIFKFKNTENELRKVTNFYTKEEYYKDGEQTGSKEVYRKGDKAIIRNITNSKENSVTYYDAEGDIWNLWFIDFEHKRVTRSSVLNGVSTPTFNDIYNPIGADEEYDKANMFWDAFNIALQRKITTGKMRDYDCYILEESRINKKDYVQVGYVSEEENNDLMRKWYPKREEILTEYSIGTVTDEDVKMPNIDGYEIREFKIPLPN